MQSYNNYSPRNRDFCTKLQTNLKIFSKVLYFNVVENLALYVGNGIKRDFGAQAESAVHEFWEKC